MFKEEDNIISIKKASHNFESIEEFSDYSPHPSEKYRSRKESFGCEGTIGFNPLICNKGCIKEHEKDEFIQHISHQFFVKEKYLIENLELYDSKSENNSINSSKFDIPSIIIRKCSSVKKAPLVDQKNEYLCIPRKFCIDSPKCVIYSQKKTNKHCKSKTKKLNASSNKTNRVSKSHEKKRKKLKHNSHTLRKSVPDRIF